MRRSDKVFGIKVRENKMIYRSLLFVPARKKMLNKIVELHAEAYIIDLEDSISKDKKDEALDALCDFLESNRDIKNIYIRVNNDRLFIEMKRIREYSNVGIMLPKFEDSKQYYQFEKDLLNHRVIALVETPLGVINALSIASCSWVEALAFGAEDYTTAMGMKNDTRLLLYAKSALLVAAKANGKAIYDTPSLQISDENLFKMEVQNAVDMGFDGKMAIHPKQIEDIHKMFSGMSIKELMRIIEAYDNAGSAVTVIEGKVYEKMHIERMRKLIHEMEES